MANISNKFVTSFSELYFRPSTLLTAELAAPKTWFAATGSGATAKIMTVTVTGTASATGTLVVRVTNTVAGSIDSVTVPVTNADSATVVGAALKTALGLNTDITAGTASAGVFTATALAAAGDLIIATEDAVAGITVTVTVPTPFVAGAGGTLLIPNVMEVGSLSNEATVIETPTFGETFKGKLRGQLDAGQLDAQLYWAPRNSTHLAMRNAATNGTACSFGIKWKSDATGTNAEYVIFDGFLSSFGIDTSFDDVAKASSTMIVDGGLTFSDDS
tara:strand:+ start:2069 stop:2890 length:822 start_codon:yes stop_codon:yes gene_type:complete